MEFNSPKSPKGAIKKAVAKYLNQGWKSIPVDPGSKACKRKGWKKIRITSDTIDELFQDNSNIGLLLGPVSGGLVDVDLDCPEAIEAAKVFLPHTEAIFGREGARSSHYLYQSADAVSYRKFNAPGNGTVLEMRSSTREPTHYTVVPPSYRADLGVHVEWEGEGCHEPTQITPAELERAASLCASAALVAQNWPNGSRHSAALALSGYLLKGGINQDVARDFVLAVCVAAIDDEVVDRLQCFADTQQKLANGEPVASRAQLIEVVGESVVKCLDDWLDITPAAFTSNTSSTSSSMASTYPKTEVGNARRFVDQHIAEVRYGTGALGWLVYTGHHWCRDIPNATMDMATKMSEKMLYDAVKTKDESVRRTQLDWALKSQSQRNLSATLDIASSDPRIVVKPEQFDADIWLLNCSNGTLNLRTGELMPHDPEHLLTKIVPAEYDPAAEAPLFKDFLRTIFPGDEDLISYVQKSLGAALIGENAEQLLFILHGNGANGKSVLVNTVMDVIGHDYAQQMNPETLMERNQTGSVRSDLANLKGVRFASASETNEQNKMDEALVKQMTGGERIRARYLYKDEFEFQPQMTIFLSTNHMPFINDQGHSIWRRITVIPFSVTIPKAQQDSQLKAKLLAERTGIFAWLVEGCLAYQKEGLKPCKAVSTATESYKADMDTLGQFLGDEVTECAGGTLGSQTLYDAYTDWCQSMNIRPLNQKNFGKRLEQRGFSRERKSSGMVWLDVELMRDASAVVCRHKKSDGVPVFVVA